VRGPIPDLRGLRRLFFEWFFGDHDP
jgi:hypothetical protein